MREALQVCPVNVDGEQVAVRLKLVRQGNLLCRVAGKVAGEDDAARLWCEFRGKLWVVGKASVRVKHPPQPTAVWPHLSSSQLSSRHLAYPVPSVLSKQALYKLTGFLYK